MASNKFSTLQPVDFQRAAYALLPPGVLFPGLIDAANQAAAIAGWSFPVWTHHAAVIDFLDVEADPATTNLLLSDWEQEYGLPDPCTPLGASTSQRQAALLAKIASSGGQSDAYLIGVAAALGFTITITHLRAAKFGVTTFGSPWNGPQCDYTMVINAPGVTVVRARFGSSAFGVPYDAPVPAELECRLRSIAPADNILLFVYS